MSSSGRQAQHRDTPGGRAARTGTALMARTAGSVFVLAGLLAVLVGVQLGLRTTGHQLLVAEGLLAVGAGLAVLRWGHRLGFTAFRVLETTGSAAVAVAVLLAGGGGPSLALATLTVLIACNDALFYPRRLAAAHTGFAVVLVLAALAVPHPDLLAPGAVIVVVVVAVGAVVGPLAGRALDAEADPLTGLLNRRGLDRVLDAEMERAARLGGPLTLVLLDLDRFKAVNDADGHAAGDALLIDVARRWSAQLGPGQLLARTGGDEFVLVLPGCGTVDGAVVADRLRAAAPRIGSSAGVATWRPGESASTLVARADTGLYRSKAAGRRRTSTDAPDGTAPPADLHRTVTEGSVEVRYQVVVDLARDGEVVGVQALARWTSDRAPVHPEASSDTDPDAVPDAPADPAEDEDRAAQPGTCALERSCRDAAALVAAAGRPLVLTVHATGEQLADPDLPVVVARVLERTGWPAQQLVLQVGEGRPDERTAPATVTTTLDALRGLGVRLAVGGLGTGTTTLARLDELAGDLLVLDRALTARLGADGVVPPLLAAVAAVGDALRIPVVAVGVETPAQDRALGVLGVPLARGPLYGRPGTVEVVAAHLAAASGARGPGARPRTDPAPAGGTATGPASSPGAFTGGAAVLG